MIVILLLAAVVIVAVLLFTSTTYAEIPVYLTTFIVAAILNKGTNYWFGTISFVTNSIAVVLQLGLAVDYAIILAHRFMEEHEDKDAREAVIVALSKAIPEISSSSLTTISGMVAMMFMQFRIGYDMGIILAKSIIFSMVAVFFLMPGLLLTFSKAIDNTHHKSFVPKITAVGKFCVATRYIIPPILIVGYGGKFRKIRCRKARQKVFSRRMRNLQEPEISGWFQRNGLLQICISYFTTGFLLQSSCPRTGACNERLQQGRTEQRQGSLRHSVPADRGMSRMRHRLHRRRHHHDQDQLP